jgi:hypothetical protein
MQAGRDGPVLGDSLGSGRQPLGDAVDGRGGEPLADLAGGPRRAEAGGDDLHVVGVEPDLRHRAKDVGRRPAAGEHVLGDDGRELRLAQPLAEHLDQASGLGNLVDERAQPGQHG